MASSIQTTSGSVEMDKKQVEEKTGEVLKGKEAADKKLKFTLPS